MRVSVDAQIVAKSSRPGPESSRKNGPHEIDTVLTLDEHLKKR